MKTPATEFLAKLGVSYTEHHYEYVEHGGTEVPASVLQVPEREVVDLQKPLLVDVALED